MAIRNLAFAAPILFCVPDSLLCAQGVGGPYWTLDGTQPQGNLGESVASAGDVNGDGYADVLVGEPDYNNGPVPSCGRVMLFLGSRLGLSATPSWIQLGPTAYASFGIAISSAGDVNADGFDDVIIGTPFVLSNEGQCYLFLGSPVGLGIDPRYRSQRRRSASQLR